MNSNQNGFGVTKIFLALLVVALVATAGWLVWDRQQNAKETSEDVDTIAITLVTASSQSPIADTRVTIQSFNGVQCIQAPCPTNQKSWSGTSDEHGVILVPDEYIQYNTYIEPEGFLAASPAFQKGKRSYTVEFNTQ